MLPSFPLLSFILLSDIYVQLSLALFFISPAELLVLGDGSHHSLKEQWLSHQQQSSLVMPRALNLPLDHSE